MKRMTRLAAKLDKAMDIDDEGNIETKKDVKIDGNLKFKSLVSSDNPDGIFDPSSGGTGGGGTGGGSKHFHSVEVSYGSTRFFFNISNSIDKPLTLSTLKTALSGKKILCNGYAYNSNRVNHVTLIYLKNGQIYADEYAIEGQTSHYDGFIVDSTYKINDIVVPE